MSLTPYNTKLEILSDLWLNYRADEEFHDFIEYNDIGLPLAYMLANNIVKPTDLTNKFIEETFDLLLAGLEIPEDEGYDGLDDLLGFEAL